MNIDIEFLKYPIGKFKLPELVSPAMIDEAIVQIKSFPSHLFKAVSPRSIGQLDTPYRPGGWTVRQLIHHCADSHMNAFIRYKLALTEENPTIKPYDEAAWANLSDATLPIESSLAIIQAIHFKWGILLDSMKPEDFKKTYFHPEKNRNQELEEVTLMYAWHSQHHLAHILHLGMREKW
ncbi:YfiT family bacillithiol transferase [Algoriphagus boritolerans]|uniref:DinB superfamily protein n=1 Tax=Algoriphagus boritolerans DSM 17298 = JCM 18970 TaxID=1120964 RepID=A0A1H5YSC7_9BACT|nr:putative metal-dependent hydrolase [Algoriphagus boritolerans]SEG26710.1 DinB superfamily protein [Algoriphagus boritolerans DSM 17298 = JCM 18970]